MKITIIEKRVLDKPLIGCKDYHNLKWPEGADGFLSVQRDTHERGSVVIVSHRFSYSGWPARNGKLRGKYVATSDLPSPVIYFVALSGDPTYILGISQAIADKAREWEVQKGWVYTRKCDFWTDYGKGKNSLVHYHIDKSTWTLYMSDSSKEIPYSTPAAEAFEWADKVITEREGAWKVSVPGCRFIHKKTQFVLAKFMGSWNLYTPEGKRQICQSKDSLQIHEAQTWAEGIIRECKFKKETTMKGDEKVEFTAGELRSMAQDCPEFEQMLKKVKPEVLEPEMPEMCSGMVYERDESAYIAASINRRQPPFVMAKLVSGGGIWHLPQSPAELYADGFRVFTGQITLDVKDGMIVKYEKG